MKKILSLALSLMMCASTVVASGCQESGSQSTPPPAQVVEYLQLEKSNCKVLGAILNRIPMKAGSYYNTYYKKSS